jgi:hypothetical protein
MAATRCWSGRKNFILTTPAQQKIRLEKPIFRRNFLLSGSLNGNRDIVIDGIHLTTPASPFDTARGNADSRSVSSM